MRLNWHRGGSVELPTTSIYFSEAMRGDIGPFGSSRHVIWRISPNAFLIPGSGHPQILIIRSIDPQARAFLARYSQARVHYLVDDDIWSGVKDPALPITYRSRLLTLIRETAAPLLQRAEHVYVTSPALQDRLPCRTKLVQPGLIEPPAELDHHADAALSIVFASTRSHREDLAAIARPFSQFLQQHPECRLETFLGDHIPPSLILPNAHHHKPRSWNDYRHVLRSRRFHIGIAPALPTHFNTARSCNKMLEFACFGAAPLYGSGVSFRKMAADAGAAVICDETPGDWLAVLNALHENRPALRAIAAANRSLALRLGDPQALRSFWLEELALPSRASSERIAA